MKSAKKSIKTDYIRIETGGLSINERVAIH